MLRSPIFVALLLTSCSTFGDLEQEHPFDSECDPGLVKNEAGECVPAANNVSNAPNNVSNEPNNEPNNVSNVPCDTQPGTCCQFPDGEYCCTDEGCCAFDLAECEQTPNNRNNPPNVNPLLSEYMLVIADAAPQSCEDQGWNGPDIFGVGVQFDNAEVFPYLASFSLGSNAVFAEDIAASVIEGFDPNAQDCSTGPSFSLGCGGWVGIGLQTDEPLDVAAGRLTVFESGPQCDGSEDLYTLSVCPMDDPDIQGQGCFAISDAVQGNFDQDVELF